MTVPIAFVLLLLGAAPLAAQPPARIDPADRCQMQLVRVRREGMRTEPTPGVTNFFAGGDVHARCRGRNIHIYADSVASYGGTVFQFLSQTNRVRYRDSVTHLDADQITYFRDNERVEAQGNVVHKDLKAGSSIVGPRVDYYRPMKQIRPETEVIGYNRPTIKYVVRDSLGKPTEPYTIVGNQVRAVGGNLMFAGGNVTIDRFDLHGAADSIWIESGRLERGEMLRNANLKSITDDGFTLDGVNIDLGLKKKELSSLKAKLKARLVSPDVTIDADSILIEIPERQVERTRAWGKEIRPVAVSGTYQIKGDSLVIESPKQKLSSVRAYGGGWAGLAPPTDSAAGPSTTSRRDWISGEKVVATFVERDSAGVTKTAIQRLEAEVKAVSFYQMAAEANQPAGSINYTRADRIIVTMKLTADTTTVDRVEAFGSVDGVHLQPPTPRRDTLRVARPDTAAARAR
ncbi:MAG: hypothetical protein FJ206_12900 [Gemmatimonadetes bacterium]|nr:hypothetical protein [Gemmatimonadota bacterium]